MSIQFAKPTYLLLLLFLIPALVYVFVNARVLLTMLSNYTVRENNKSRSIRMRLVCRVLCWALAWISICIALAGPSWGTELIPIQTSGSAVSFVFDVSYSMNASDAYEGSSITRLEHSKQFSNELIRFLPGVSLSAIITKGEGYLAVPMTEDFYSISNLIESLSPAMLSAPGSSLAKGIDTAIESFPPQTARSSYIVVLSDGDDTGEGLEQAVNKATQFGSRVIFVGFGSERETEVLAGDGVTKVQTALRKEALQSIALQDNVDFLLARDTNSIDTIINEIKPSMYYTTSSTTTAYEVQTVKRHTVFLRLALVFFILGISVYSFVPTKIFLFSKLKRISLFSLVLYCAILSGCSGWTKDSAEVLQGSYYWSQQDYQKAVASFLEITTRAKETSNSDLLQYGLFGLSSTYLMQGESQASLLKINEMSPTVLEGLDFARWYNKGVIFHRQGNYSDAAYCFKRALLINSDSIQAKINLELSLKEGITNEQQSIQERVPVSEQLTESGVDDAVFSLIRESEGNQWKSREVAPEKSDIIDF